MKREKLPTANLRAKGRKGDEQSTFHGECRSPKKVIDSNKTKCVPIGMTAKFPNPHGTGKGNITSRLYDTSLGMHFGGKKEKVWADCAREKKEENRPSSISILRQRIRKKSGKKRGALRQVGKRVLLFRNLAKKRKWIR